MICPPHRSVPVLAAAALLVALGVLTGCAADDPSVARSTGAAGVGDADVETGTPGLRERRQRAGIPACDAVPRRQATGPVDDGLPDVTLPCLGGGADVDLASLRGPVVVNLWASWCAPCRAELPYFAELHDSGVEVLGVNFEDTQPGAALAMAADTGVTFPSAADVEGSLRAPLRISALPTTVFVDRDGTVTAALAQRFTSYDELTAAAAEHLGVRS